MSIDIHHYFHHHDGTPDPRVDEILGLLRNINRRVNQMSAEMDALTAQVAASRTVIDGAVVLINGIAGRIAAAGTDPAALTALTADLRSETDALAAAVTANTPAATTGTGTTGTTGTTFNANDLTPNGSTMADGTTIRNTPGADPANPMAGFNPALPVTA